MRAGFASEVLVERSNNAASAAFLLSETRELVEEIDDNTLSIEGESKEKRLENFRHKRSLAISNLSEAYRSTNVSLMWRTIEYLAPWPKYTYPGRQKVIIGLLPRAAKWSAVRFWASDRGTIPAEVSRALASELEKRLEVGFALRKELIANAKKKEAIPNLRGSNLRKKKDVKVVGTKKILLKNKKRE